MVLDGSRSFHVLITTSQDDEVPRSQNFHRISTKIKVLSNFVGISFDYLELLSDSKNYLAPFVDKVFELVILLGSRRF